VWRSGAAQGLLGALLGSSSSLHCSSRVQRECACLLQMQLPVQQQLVVVARVGEVLVTQTVLRCFRHAGGHLVRPKCG
jgi:hypothetical protein